MILVNKHLLRRYDYILIQSPLYTVSLRKRDIHVLFPTLNRMQGKGVKAMIQVEGVSGDIINKASLKQ